MSVYRERFIHDMWKAVCIIICNYSENFDTRKGRGTVFHDILHVCSLFCSSKMRINDSVYYFKAVLHYLVPCNTAGESNLARASF